MPKMKTHKGLKKRVKVSATGKVRYKKTFGSHLMSHKSGDRVRSIRQKLTLEGGLAKVIRRSLGE